MKNYYQILELSESASKEVIEKAYKALAKKYHPDTQPMDKKGKAEEKLKDINEAYDVLSDNFLKEQYDQELWKMREEKRRRFIPEKQEIKSEPVKEPEERKRRMAETPEEGMKAITKAVFVESSIWERLKKLKSIDILAFMLSIGIVLLIGLILFAIPVTNGWMRENFIDTPLTQAIIRIFHH